MKKSVTIIISIILLIATTLVFTGCSVDLGNYESIDKYYDSFDDIIIYPYDYEEGDSLFYNTISMRDLYNESTQNDMTCYINKSDKYRYMTIEADKELKVESLALFINSVDKAGDFRVTLYLCNDPNTVFDFGSEKDLFAGIYYFENGNKSEYLHFDGAGKVDNNSNDVSAKKEATYTYNEELRQATFNWPDKAYIGSYEYNVTLYYTCTLDESYENLVVSKQTYIPDFDERTTEVLNFYYLGNATDYIAVNSSSTTLRIKEWGSFMSSGNWTLKDGEKVKSVTITDGQYIVIQFDNNNAIHKRFKLDEMSFTFTNLMIRCV